MRVLFTENCIRKVSSVEAVPMDVGDGNIVGTQLIFKLPDGDKFEYIYKDTISLEDSAMRAADFIQQLYLKGAGNLTKEPVEKL